VPGRIEAATSNLEWRAERLIDRLRELAQEAGLLAVLGIAALVAALTAAAVGLVAIYRLTAEAYGDYAGLGAVAAILIGVALILVALMVARVRSLEAPKVTTTAPASDAEVSQARRPAAEESAVPKVPPATFAAPTSAFAEDVPAVESVPSPPYAPASADDLIEPLTYILSDVIRIPTQFLCRPVHRQTARRCAQQCR
jgi:hypothetical protein